MISGDAGQSSYVTILWHPRWTIRRIVDADPRRRVLAIVTVAALLTGMALLISGPSTALATAGRPIAAMAPARWYAIHVAMLVFLPPFAIAALYLEGALIGWAGGLLGGTARSIEVRAALAWARVPMIVESLAIMALVPFGLRLLPMATLNPGVMMHSMLRLGGVNILFMTWEAALVIATIAEVHRFSPLKSIAACAIAGLTFAGAIAVASLTAILSALPFLQ